MLSPDDDVLIVVSDSVEGKHHGLAIAVGIEKMNKKQENKSSITKLSIYQISTLYSVRSSRVPFPVSRKSYVSATCNPID